MLWAIVLLSLVLQTGQPVRPSIIARSSTPPNRNYWIIYYDDSFLFAARNYGDERDRGGNTEPGLFVHSKQHSRWIQILQISTAGGRFGKSESDDPEIQKKLSRSQVGWDFTNYAHREYIEQPLRTPGSIAFPEVVIYDAAKEQYELKYFSSWGVISAETVLYINRKDLANAFNTD